MTRRRDLCITAGQIGQLTLAIALYPGGTRATGVGWAAALARAGAIVGPGGLGRQLIAQITTWPPEPAPVLGQRGVRPAR